MIEIQNVSFEYEKSQGTLSHIDLNIQPVSYTHLDVYKRQEELEKAQKYAERITPEKPSIRERLEDAKRECAEHKPPEGKKPGRDVPEHDCL